MNSAPYPMPSLRSLYWSDAIIRNSASNGFFGLVVAAGMLWAGQSVPTVDPTADNLFDAGFAKWVSLGGLVVSAVAAAFFAQRYLFVKQVLNHGAVVRGTVEKLDSHTYRTDSGSSSSIRSTSTAYWATIRYAVHGVERNVRFKLPHSGSTYGMRQGEGVDLIVLDSAPKKPLIYNVYLNPPGSTRIVPRRSIFSILFGGSRGKFPPR